MAIDFPVHFYHVVFQNKANFDRTIFNRDVHFKHSEFNGDAQFKDAKFNKDAYFTYMKFNGSAHFMSSKFNGYAYFGDSEFMDNADFIFSQFNGPASFRFLEFYGYTYFWGSKFNADADFIHNTFEKEAYFNDALFNANASFNGSQFKGDLLFENTTFLGMLSLTKTRYDELYTRWYNIDGHLVYDDTAYISLMKNFKALGYFEDYDSCYFQYRKEHRARPWPAVNDGEEWFRKLIDYPLEWFYGYGTKPFNAFLFSIAIILVFTLFWWEQGLGGPNDMTPAVLPVGEEWVDGDIIDILGFSVTVFLSGTKLFIAPPALPRIEGRSGFGIKWAFILERLLGGLFSILLFISIGGTIVRAA